MPSSAALVPAVPVCGATPSQSLHGSGVHLDVASAKPEPPTVPMPAALSPSSPIVCGVPMQMECSGRMASAFRWPRCWRTYCLATTEAISCRPRSVDLVGVRATADPMASAPVGRTGDRYRLNGSAVLGRTVWPSRRSPRVRGRGAPRNHRARFQRGRRQDRRSPIGRVKRVKRAGSTVTVSTEKPQSIRRLPYVPVLPDVKRVKL